MIGTASTENRTFESAETLAHDVAEWLCRLAQASDRAFRGVPVGRLDSPTSI